MTRTGSATEQPRIISDDAKNVMLTIWSTGDQDGDASVGIDLKEPGLQGHHRLGVCRFSQIRSLIEALEKALEHRQ
jgi:hypothetical protein